MLTLVLITIFLFFDCYCESLFRFKVFPDHSKACPLISSPTYEIIPEDTSLDKDTILQVERMFTSNLTDTSNYVLDAQNITLRAPFVKTFQKWFGYTHEDFHPEYIRISAFDSQTKKLIGNYDQSTIETIYWNFTFYNAKYDFEFEEDGEPGSVFIIAKPRTKEDEELEKLTKAWYFKSIKFTNYPDYTMSYDWYGGCENYQIAETNKLHIVFNRPRIFYFTFTSDTNEGTVSPSITDEIYSKVHPRNEQDEFIGGAVVMCYEDGSCPDLVSGFNGIVYYVQNKIPGNKQLPIQKRKVSVVEGTPLWIRMFRDYFESPKPSVLDIEIPTEGFGEIDNFFDFYDLSILGKSSERDGYSTYQYDITSSESKFPIAFSFSNSINYDKEYSIYLRIEGGDWQKLTVTPKQLQPLSYFPKLIKTEFTWTYMGFFKTYEVYESLGYNSITGPDYCVSTEYLTETYTPEKREEKYPGSFNCPGVLLFGCRHEDLGLYSVFDSIQMNSPDFNRIPSSIQGSERTEEENKLTNAINFFVSTGENHRVNDLAYNGAIYQAHLEHFGKYLEITKPDCISFDIEDFISPITFLENLQYSQNAQDRRKNGESDEELVDRICKEFLEDIKAVFDQYAPTANIVWYAVDAYKNAPSWGFIEYDLHTQVFGSKFIAQPELYKNHRHPKIVQNTCRANKMYTGTNLFYPMPTFGCWGAMSPYLTFDWTIHSFINGANGIQMYGKGFVDDHAFFLYFKEAIEIIGPYEETIFYGENVFYDIIDVENLVVSSMKYKDKYLVAVSPDYSPLIEPSQTKGSFTLLNSGNDLFFRITDLRNKNSKINYYLDQNGNLVISFDQLRSTVLYVEPQTFTFILSMVFVGVICVSVALVLIFVLVLIVFFTFCIRKKQQDKEMNEF